MLLQQLRRPRPLLVQSQKRPFAPSQARWGGSLSPAAGRSATKQAASRPVRLRSHEGQTMLCKASLGFQRGNLGTVTQQVGSPPQWGPSQHKPEKQPGTPTNRLGVTCFTHTNTHTHWDKWELPGRPQFSHMTQWGVPGWSAVSVAVRAWHWRWESGGLAWLAG